MQHRTDSIGGRRSAESKAPQYADWMRSANTSARLISGAKQRVARVWCRSNRQIKPRCLPQTEGLNRRLRIIEHSESGCHTGREGEAYGSVAAFKGHWVASRSHQTDMSQIDDTNRARRKRLVSGDLFYHCATRLH